MFRFFCSSFRNNLCSDKQGSIAVLSAVVLPVLVISASLAVDFGSVYLERRSLQGATDLAAIAAAAQIDRAEIMAARTLTANGFGEGSKVKIIRGNYNPDQSVPVGQRFRSFSEPYNAVQVQVVRNTPLFFGRFFAGPHLQLNVEATSATTAQATYSVGSRLLAIRGGLLNQILSSLLGGEVNLTVMDYDALVNAQVRMQPFLEALATELNITAGSFNDVLNANATVGDVLDALVTASGTMSPRAVTAIRHLRYYSEASSRSVKLSKWIDLGPFGMARLGDPRPGFDAAVSVMELVRTSAVLADGKRQVRIALDLSIPGVTSSTLTIEIGEPMQYSGWMAAGTTGSQVRTAQTRLYLLTEVEGPLLQKQVRIRLPVRLELATAQARLAKVTCSGSGSGSTATIATRSNIAEVWIGDENTNVTKSDGEFVPLIETPLLKVSARSYLRSGSATDKPLQFTQYDIDNRVIKRINANGYSQTLISSLLDNIEIQTNVAGLDLQLAGTSAAAVKTLLTTVAKPLDEVAHTLLSALGVHLGEADVRVHGIRCGSAVLAQ